MFWFELASNCDDGSDEEEDKGTTTLLLSNCRLLSPHSSIVGTGILAFNRSSYTIDGWIIILGSHLVSLVEEASLKLPAVAIVDKAPVGNV